MKVVLLERVVNLGFIGDIVSVKDGYGRNFLIPQKKALRATKENVAYFNEQKVHIEADNARKKQDAERIAEKMAGLSVGIIRQAGEFGRLFGSVRNSDIAQAIGESGFTVQKGQVRLDTHIKTLGAYKVQIVLHPDVSVDVGVIVAQSKDEIDAIARGETPGDDDANTKQIERKGKKHSARAREDEIEGDEDLETLDLI
ncbi:MAG: 50S ribosomal protein L9 [Holosporales bacterium]|jgi:large subunit ribosomal protein L9|nr:50S ribosomal protein L9 [Holosporales bacterium]